MLKFPFPPGDQKDTGSCLSFAVCAAIEYLILIKYGEKIKLSEFALHKQIYSSSGGSSIESLAQFMKPKGFINYGSKFFLFDQKEQEIKEDKDISKFTPSTPYIMVTPKQDKWERYFFGKDISITERQISLCLAQETPVLTSVSNVGAANEDETKRHAVLLIGEDKSNYIFRNSWGGLYPVFKQKKQVFLRQCVYLVVIPHIQVMTENNQIKLFN